MVLLILVKKTKQNTVAFFGFSWLFLVNQTVNSIQDFETTVLLWLLCVDYLSHLNGINNKCGMCVNSSAISLGPINNFKYFLHPISPRYSLSFLYMLHTYIIYNMSIIWPFKNFIYWYISNMDRDSHMLRLSILSGL